MYKTHFKLCSVLLLLAMAFPYYSLAHDTSNWSDRDIFKTNYFIENRGQYDSLRTDGLAIAFGLEHNDARVYFNAQGFDWHLCKLVKKRKGNEKSEENEPEIERENGRIVESQLIKMRWINANPKVKITKEQSSTHYFSYGADPCYGYTKITYNQMYPGIDIVYTIDSRGGFEYSLILAPGADLSKVKFQYLSTNKFIKSKIKQGQLVIKNHYCPTKVVVN